MEPGLQGRLVLRLQCKKASGKQLGRSLMHYDSRTSAMSARCRKRFRMGAAHSGGIAPTITIGQLSVHAES